jgi:hypothetical protein
MHKTPEWVTIGIAIVWSLTPAVLLVLAWRNWARVSHKMGVVENLIDDPALIIGQIFGTVSCCALIPFYIPVTSRWEQLRIEALEYGVIVSIISALIGVFILPFGHSRSKWLTLGTCLLNAGIVVMFFRSLD